LIAPSDTLQIEVFNVDAMNRTVQVDATGRVDLPLIGGVQAADRTASGLAKEIAQRLGDKYLQNPKVTVFVKSSATRRFTIEGAVKEPGVFEWQERTTLMQVIAKAKGADPSARIDRIMVFRKISNQRVAGIFNLTQIREGKVDDPEIYPDDLVVVSDSASARWWRAILGASPLYMILGR
jgi:polysaccharide export outer membrane protein